MSLSGKVVFTFIVLFSASTCLLSDGVLVASQSQNNEVPSFTKSKTAGEDTTSLAGKAPYHATFNSKQLVGPMESYSWNFGDGEMAQGAVASHVFLSPGTYAVTLTAKAKTGQIHEEKVIVNVTSKH